MKKTIIITALVLILSSINFVSAQNRFEHPISTGMGATGVTFIGEHSANFVNPANLMLDDYTPQFSLTIGQIGVGIGGPLADIRTYNDYLTTGELLDATRQKSMLDNWVGSSSNPGELHYAGFNVSFVPVGASYRMENQAFSFASRIRSYGKFGVSRGLMEAAIGGFNSELFEEARGVNAKSQVVSLTELSFGYARKVFDTQTDPLFDRPLRIYVGAAPKLLLGFNANTFRMESDLRVSGDSLLVHNYNFRIHTAGDLSQQLDRYISDRNTMDEMPSLGDYLETPNDAFSVNSVGLGFDLGATAELELSPAFLDYGFFGDGKRFFRFGISITDIGRLSFTEDAATYQNSGELVWRGVAIDQDRLRDEFDSNLGDYFNYVVQDSIGTEVYLDLKRDDRDRTTGSLPAHMNIGFQLQAGKMMAALDLGAGFNNVGTNSKLMSLGMGFEYRVANVWPIRFGFNTGGANAASWTAGTGIITNNYSFNIGVMFVGNSQNNGTWIAAGVSALTFRF